MSERRKPKVRKYKAYKGNRVYFLDVNRDKAKLHIEGSGKPVDIELEKW